MGGPRIEELKQQLAALNASIARLAAIGQELSRNLSDAEASKAKRKAGARSRRRPPAG